jgi:hypothetical protein
MILTGLSKGPNRGFCECGNKLVDSVESRHFMAIYVTIRFSVNIPILYYEESVDCKLSDWLADNRFYSKLSGLHAIP